VKEKERFRVSDRRGRDVSTKDKEIRVGAREGLSRVRRKFSPRLYEGGGRGEEEEEEEEEKNGGASCQRQGQRSLNVGKDFDSRRCCAPR